MTISTVRKFGVGVASAAMVLGLAAPALAADGPVANRLAGADRYDTAIAIAMDKTEFANPSVVYVSRGDVLVDAVTAGSLRNGPMLLVNDDKDVQAKVAEAIRKLAPEKVIVVGGEKAVSKDVVAKITPAGVTSERIEGKDRFETAAKIADAYAKQLKAAGQDANFKTVYLANGETLVDALAGGQLVDGPILLTDGADKLPDATATALNKIGTKPLRALGGEKAVSQDVLKQAGVDQTILLNSYVENYKSGLKASADADLKYNGYLVAGPKVKVDDLLGKLTFDTDTKKAGVQKAKVKATFPKVDKTYIKTAAQSGNLWSVKDANGKVTAGTYAAATALGTVSYKDEAGVVNYAGTKTTFENTYTASQAEFTVTGAAANLFGTPGSTDSTFNITGNFSLATSTNSSNQAFGGADNKTDKVLALSYLFPGKVTTATSIKKFLQDIGVTTFPASSGDSYLAQSTDKTAANTAKGVFEQAVNVAKSVASSNLAGLQSANDAAKKAMKDAQDAFDKATAGGVNTDVARIAGNDRYATSVEIAKAVFGDNGQKQSPSRLYFADGTAFADAAVSGMLTKGPVLLVGKDMVPGSVNDYAKGLTSALTMSRKSIIALGGPAVISDKNLTDELNVLAPITASKDYTAAFGPNVGTATLASAGNVSNNQTVKFATEVKNVPNGGNVKYVWQVNTGDGWKDYSAENIASLHGTSSYGVTAIAFSQDTSGQIATITVGGSSGTEKAFSLRLAVKVVNANGDELVATQYSTEVKLKTQVG